MIAGSTELPRVRAMFEAGAERFVSGGSVIDGFFDQRWRAYWGSGYARTGIGNNVLYALSLLKP